MVITDNSTRLQVSARFWVALALCVVLLAFIGFVRASGNEIATLEAHPMASATVSFGEERDRRTFSGTQSRSMAWGDNYRVNHLTISYAVPEGRAEEAVAELRQQAEALGYVIVPGTWSYELQGLENSRYPGVWLRLTHHGDEVHLKIAT